MAHVFISYAHADGDFAQALIRQIEQAGFDSWIDSEHLRAGDDWTNAIDHAIWDSFALIVILSPEAVASEYVTYEWACAWGARIRVIPVLLRSTSLHPRLEKVQCLDFTNRSSRPWDKLIQELRKVEDNSNNGAIQLPRDAPTPIKNAVKALDSHDPREYKAGIEHLAHMNHPLARESLVLATQHMAKDVRIGAALQLSRIEEFDDIRVLSAYCDAYESEVTP
jgi:hypothetical protein